MPRTLPWIRLTLAALLAACTTDAPPASATKTVRDPFIALQSDFADFESWRSWEVPDVGSNFGHRRGGPSHLYVNRAVPAFHEPMPVGTILIKTVEVGEDPTGWDIHGMVKRGGDFNPAGAVGWEYFELGFTEEREPVVLWRGEGDAQNPGGYGRLLDGTPVGCNECHGVASAGDHAFARALFSPES